MSNVSGGERGFLAAVVEAATLAESAKKEAEYEAERHHDARNWRSWAYWDARRQQAEELERSIRAMGLEVLP